MLSFAISYILGLLNDTCKCIGLRNLRYDTIEEINVDSKAEPLFLYHQHSLGAIIGAYIAHPTAGNHNRINPYVRRRPICLSTRLKSNSCIVRKIVDC